MVWWIFCDGFTRIFDGAWFGGFSGGRAVCAPWGGWGPTEILLVQPSIYQTCNIDVRWYNAPSPLSPFPAFLPFLSGNHLKYASNPEKT